MTTIGSPIDSHNASDAGKFDMSSIDTAFAFWLSPSTEAGPADTWFITRPGYVGAEPAPGTVKAAMGASLSIS